mmetsp:Transcript_57269/g.170775  ORF Transcript_57269/g.170775 Transcript_57269/m.170775 type:complete len:219 (+) Transcript_57269:147-803(+)
MGSASWLVELKLDEMGRSISRSKQKFKTRLREDPWAKSELATRLKCSRQQSVAAPPLPLQQKGASPCEDEEQRVEDGAEERWPQGQPDAPWPGWRSASGPSRPRSQQQIERSPRGYEAQCQGAAADASKLAVRRPAVVESAAVGVPAQVLSPSRVGGAPVVGMAVAHSLEPWQLARVGRVPAAAAVGMVEPVPVPSLRKGLGRVQVEVAAGATRVMAP